LEAERNSAQLSREERPQFAGYLIRPLFYEEVAALDGTSASR
jgi:hypothetical protein